ncbi:MAG: hypothetical protein IPM46_09940 [Flavobacteriales bacterium]|nr:hypothetical protein [Flavobacteriales bacterium]
MKKLLLPFCLLTLSATAQPGTLDPEFSGDGMLLWNANAWSDEINAVTVQSDDKVVGAGYWGDGNYASVLVQRLMPDGTPDPGFGLGGVVATPAQAFFHYGYGVGVQSDGRIVVAGLSYDENMDGNVVLLGYTENGVLDISFGDNGFVNTDLGGGEFTFQAAYAMRVLPDDRILIMGVEGESGLMCARFDADGGLDTGFGTNGVASAGVPFSTGLCLDVADDGSIIAGGFSVSKESDWLLARFDSDGVLMPGFGNGGIVAINLNGGGAEPVRGVCFTADGGVAACGYRSNTGSDDAPAVALLDANGELVSGFGTNGVQLMPFTAPQWGQARSIAAQPGGKLLVAGFRARTGSTADNDFLLYRLLSDGSFDPSFAGAGQVYTDISGSNDRAYAMALAPDGAIVLAGYGTDDDKSTAYARYLNDSGMGLRDPVNRATIIAYPNPATDHVRVQLREPGRVDAVELVGVDGRTIPVLWIRQSDAITVRFSPSLAPGPYLLRLTLGGEKTTVPIAIGMR